MWGAESDPSTGLYWVHLEPGVQFLACGGDVVVEVGEIVGTNTLPVRIQLQLACVVTPYVDSSYELVFRELDLRAMPRPLMMTIDGRIHNRDDESRCIGYLPQQ